MKPRRSFPNDRNLGSYGVLKSIGRDLPATDPTTRAQPRKRFANLPRKMFRSWRLKLQPVPAGLRDEGDDWIDSSASQLWWRATGRVLEGVLRTAGVVGRAYRNQDQHEGRSRVLLPTLKLRCVQQMRLDWSKHPVPPEVFPTHVLATSTRSPITDATRDANRQLQKSGGDRCCCCVVNLFLRSLIPCHAFDLLSFNKRQYKKKEKKKNERKKVQTKPK